MNSYACSSQHYSCLYGPSCTTSIRSSHPRQTPSPHLRRHIPRTPRSNNHRRHPLCPHGPYLSPDLADFQGFEGQYIRYHDSYNHTNETDRLAGAKFKIAPGLDPSLRDLTQNIIKIATWYGSVTEFINVQSKPDFGVVNHALCAAIRKLLRVDTPFCWG